MVLARFRARASDRINRYAAREAESIYTSFLSSQDSLFCAGEEADGDGGSQHSNARVSGVLNAPVHLDILRGVYDLAEICPMVEVQAVCQSGRITPVQQRKANRILETFSNTLEQHFSAPSPSKDLTLLVHIYYVIHHPASRHARGGTKSIFPFRKTPLTTLKVAYSLFDRRTKKFLMAKKVSTGSSSFDSSSSLGSYGESEAFSTSRSCRDDACIEEVAKEQSQRIVAELSFLLREQRDKSDSPFFEGGPPSSD